MIGIYNYTVILTYLGLLSSITGILLLNQDGKYLPAAICLLLFAGLCDMFDGRVARTKKRTSMEENFGAQIDSLSDMICFGVFPAVIGYQLTDKAWWAIPFLALFALAGLIRLAFFDVRAIEKKYNPEAEIGNDYIGLPITCSSLLMPLIYAIMPLYLLFIGKDYALGYRIFVIVAMSLTAIAFVSPFRVKKPNKVGVTILITFGALLAVGGFLANAAYHNSL